ncbi:MAG: TlpA disulfide reductase family protein [Anaerolineae bacterium]
MPFERAEGRMMRAFTLPGLDGTPVDTFRFRGRQPLIVLFHAGAACAPCADLLQDLAANAARIEAEGAQIVSVSVGNGVDDRALAEALAPHVLTLFDSEGKASRLQGFNLPALIITDRYGEIFAYWQADTDQALPDVDDVYGWLVWIEAQCATCTTINWAKVGAS